MKILAAINLQKGKCVQQPHGEVEPETAPPVYHDDPAAVAETWEQLGVDWLHVVNLDGAFDGSAAAPNRDALQAILDQVKTPVQFGGGLRRLEDIERALTMGVSRVVIGSMAADRPRQMLDILGQFGPEQIVLGLDVKGGQVANHGWRQLAQTNPVELAQLIHTAGLRHVIYTDHSGDGQVSGINVEAAVALARAGDPAGAAHRFQVIVSGGVADLEDVSRVKAAEAEGLEGLILGQALYNGQINLVKALQVARGEVA